MKKNPISLLLFIFCMSSMVAAQTKVSKYNHLESKPYRKAESAASRKYFTGAEEIKIDPNAKVRPLKPVHARGTQGLTSEVIGITQYDLQTNSSVCRRLVNHGNGKLTATWTRGINPNAFDERGTGYNFFDGTSWGSDSTDRIEDFRCGWPEPVLTRSGYEVIVSHYAITGDARAGLNKASRSFEGTGPWTNVWMTQTSDTGATWPRMANSGDTIHVIASRMSSSYNNVKGGISYFRSYNAGLSFTGPIPLPGIDSTTFWFGMSGDEYAIDVRGNTVAIVVGEYNTFLFKSTDAGQTWTSRPIQTLSDSLYRGKVGQKLDINEASDGSFSIVLDSSNNAHVFFGRYIIIDSDSSATTPGYYPWAHYNWVADLMYWNESLETPVAINKARLKDDNGDGNITLRDDTSIYRNNVTNNLYGSSLISMPSAAIGTDGVIYVVYASIVENTNSTQTDDGELFRNLYAMASHDGGKAWTYPIHITKEEYFGDEYTSIEAVFGSLAKKVDDKLHILYQMDNLPGVAVTKIGETTSLNYDHPFGDNEIRYVTIPTCRFSARIAETDTFFCLQGSIQLHASGGTTYRWNHPELLDDSTSANPVITLNKNIPDNYDNYFVVTVTDSNGCESKAEVGVFLLRAKAGPDIAVCSGEAAIIKAVPMLVGSFSWTPTEGLDDSTSFNPLASPTVNTDYILDIGLGTCADSDTVTVRVVDLPLVSFTASKNTAKINDTLIFTNTTQGNIQNYKFNWNFGDATPLDTINWSTKHVYKNPATIKVKLTLTDISSGCSNSFSVNITIKVGMEENKLLKGVTLTQNNPNPFYENTTFTISVTEETQVNFYVTNLLNQKINILEKAELTPGTYTYNISSKNLGLNKGVYMYHLETDKGSVTGKMVVQ